MDADAGYCACVMCLCLENVGEIVDEVGCLDFSYAVFCATHFANLYRIWGTSNGPSSLVENP